MVRVTRDRLENSIWEGKQPKYENNNDKRESRDRDQRTHAGQKLAMEMNDTRTVLVDDGCFRLVTVDGNLVGLAI
jgi:hypothetical protein